MWLIEALKIVKNQQKKRPIFSGWSDHLKNCIICSSYYCFCVTVGARSLCPCHNYMKHGHFTLHQC